MLILEVTWGWCFHRLNHRRQKNTEVSEKLPAGPFWEMLGWICLFTVFYKPKEQQSQQWSKKPGAPSPAHSTHQLRHSCRLVLCFDLTHLKKIEIDFNHVRNPKILPMPWDFAGSFYQKSKPILLLQILVTKPSSNRERNNRFNKTSEKQGQRVRWYIKRSHFLKKNRLWWTSLLVASTWGSKHSSAAKLLLIRQSHTHRNLSLIKMFIMTENRKCWELPTQLLDCYVAAKQWNSLTFFVSLEFC